MLRGHDCVCERERRGDTLLSLHSIHGGERLFLSHSIQSRVQPVKVIAGSLVPTKGSLWNSLPPDVMMVLKVDWGFH